MRDSRSNIGVQATDVSVRRPWLSTSLVAPPLCQNLAHALQQACVYLSALKGVQVCICQKICHAEGPISFSEIALMYLWQNMGAGLTVQLLQLAPACRGLPLQRSSNPGQGPGSSLPTRPARAPAPPCSEPPPIPAPPRDLAPLATNDHHPPLLPAPHRVLACCGALQHASSASAGLGPLRSTSGCPSRSPAHTHAATSPDSVQGRALGRPHVIGHYPAGIWLLERVKGLQSFLQSPLPWVSICMLFAEPRAN